MDIKSKNLGENDDYAPTFFDPPHSTSYTPRPTAVAVSDDEGGPECDEDASASASASAFLRTGRRKWLGGDFHAPSSTFLGVPAHSPAVLRLRVPSQHDADAAVSCSLLPLPDRLKYGRFKYLRGMISPLYPDWIVGIPCWAREILRVHAVDGTVGSIPLPPAVVASNRRWLYHGATCDVSGRYIYCIPCNADRVLRIDLLQNAAEEVGPDLSQTCCGPAKTNRWYGGLRGRDGAVYGVPYNAPGLLRIVPAEAAEDVVVQILGNYGCGGWKWHGGCYHPEEGNIYAFPSHAAEAMVIDTDPGTDDDKRISLLPIPDVPEVHPPDIRGYRWAGGLVGADGAVYAIPSDCDALLRVHDGKVSCVGTGVVPKGKNKWQNAVLAEDGAVYALPCDASCVLRVDTTPPRDKPVQGWDAKEDNRRVTLFGENVLDNSKNKYQGGFLGPDGRMYGSPECADSILIVDPHLWDGDQNLGAVSLVPY